MYEFTTSRNSLTTLSRVQGWGGGCETKYQMEADMSYECPISKRQHFKRSHFRQLLLSEWGVRNASPIPGITMCVRLKYKRVLLWVPASKATRKKYPDHPSIIWYDQEELKEKYAFVSHFTLHHLKPAAAQHVSHQHRFDWHWHGHLKREWFRNLLLESWSFGAVPCERKEIKKGQTA